MGQKVIHVERPRTNDGDSADNFEALGDKAAGLAEACVVSRLLFDTADWRRLIGERRRRTPPWELSGISLVMTQLPWPFARW